MRTKVVLALAGLLILAGAGSVGLALMLDRHLSYRSPLRRSAHEETPRMRALVDMARRAQERARAAAELAEMMRNLTPEKMVKLGERIVRGKGLCMNCHKIYGEGHGVQGPDLGGVGERAGSRIAGMSDVEYLTQSLYEPDAFRVPGFEAGGMIPVNKPPIGLSDTEILFVVAYLQSLGGKTTVTPDTKLR